MTTSGSPPLPADTIRPTLMPDDIARTDAHPRLSFSAESRYTDEQQIGEGGTAKVIRSRDVRFDRAVARKIIKDEHTGHPMVARAFVDEAHLTAILDHPGIVPVYDLGKDERGRPWFTMKEVRGRTLSELISEVHADATSSDLRQTPFNWTRERLIDVLRRVCEAVGYAHSKGVVHRDLKPANIMVGAYGEVLVMDWGLARRSESADGTGKMVAGTPAYMSPEQASGDFYRLTPPSDVYSIGLMLYAIITGNEPYPGHDINTVLNQAASGLQVNAIPRGISEELFHIFETATQFDAKDRPQDAGELAEALRLWQEGAKRRARAKTLFEEAQALLATADANHADLFDASRALKAEAHAQDSWAPIEQKRLLWKAEDQLHRRLVEAAANRTRAIELLRLVLSEDPGLQPARVLLADRLQRQLETAEEENDAQAIAHFSEQLRATDPYRHAQLLQQPAYLTLHTKPTASVRLFRQTSVDRRLTPVFERDLGRTPLNQVELAPGAWLLECTVAGRPAVRYPIVLRRGEHWDGVAPDETHPSSLPIPRQAELPPSDVYIPAGWMWSGGDESAQSSGPRKRVWLDGFIIRKHPVTHREFIAFLDDLVAQGKQDLASRFVPSWHSRQGGKAPRLYEVNERGHYQPCPDPDGDLCELDWPVYLVTRDAAEAYAQWESSRTNQPWRLPWELEWEKAARGVDGRRFPWGDHPDPSFANVRGSRPTRALPTAIGAQDHDESIYGVCGLAGNVQDWCLDRWESSGSPIQNGRLVRRPSTGEELCTVKGGAWSFVIDAGRCAFRIHRTPVQRRESIGFRLVRSLPA